MKKTCCNCYSRTAIKYYTFCSFLTFVSNFVFILAVVVVVVVVIVAAVATTAVAGLMLFVGGCFII